MTSECYIERFYKSILTALDVSPEPATLLICLTQIMDQDKYTLIISSEEKNRSPANLA